MFLPVGQGAFYCEKFSEEDFCGKVNVVYDCGSISGLSLLKSVIEWTFDSGEEIDAVFISHLHEDHINGLPFLMERCLIKRVYLPLIQEGDLVLMRLAYGIQRHPKPSLFYNQQDAYFKATNFVQNVFLNPSGAIVNLAQQYNSDNRFNVVEIPIENGDQMHSRADKTSQEIFGDIISSGLLSKWTYAPFNVRNELEADTVRARFVRVFGGDMSPSHIAKLIDEASNKKTTLTQIRELYDGINGGFNANSMVLYSGAEDKTLGQSIDAENFANKNVNAYKIPSSTLSGCLYMGDFMAAANSNYWVKLKNAYTKHWKNIGCVQIPHHGSQHNFNDEILKMDAYSVISAGFGNKYHHPSNAVLLKYEEDDKFPFIVTQDKTSRFCTSLSIV